MINFAQAQYLILLLLVPLFFVAYAVMRHFRKRRLAKLGDPVLVKELMPSVSASKGWVRVTLFALAFFFFIIGLSRPQIGAKLKERNIKGVEIMIALDVSNSMMAEDYSPNRLERAKLAISSLVDKLRDDRIGLVVFAGTSFVQLPVTTDYASAKMFLNSINTESVPIQGTALGEALMTCIRSFSNQSERSRVIIVITDGEDHEGGALDAAKEARKKGINVFILGVGNGNGAPIPVGNGYLTDASGKTVMTALNERMCQEVAQAGNGTYIHVDNTSDAQEKLNSEISKLQKGTTQNVIYSEYDEQFQAFGILVLILIITEVCILEAKNPILKNIRLFRRKK